VTNLTNNPSSFSFSMRIAQTLLVFSQSALVAMAAPQVSGVTPSSIEAIIKCECTTDSLLALSNGTFERLAFPVSAQSITLEVKITNKGGDTYRILNNPVSLVESSGKTDRFFPTREDDATKSPSFRGLNVSIVEIAPSVAQLDESVI
jgi:hypothetical protein